MSEFNSKKFYGYSMQNDPDIAGTTWNTRNFEFSCVRPETVQRAIEKVGSDSGASLKQKKSSLLSKLREKCGDAENENDSYPDRDPDVETNMSRAQDTRETHESDEESDHDDHSNKSRHSKRSDKSGHSKNSDKSKNSKYSEKLKQSKQSTQDSETETDERRTKRVRGGESVIESAYFEQYESPQPKWVEVSEPEVSRMEMFDLIPAQSPLLSPFGYPPVMFQAPYMYMPPMPQMMPSMGFNASQQQQQQQQQAMMGNYVYANPYGYDPNQNQNQAPNSNPNNFEIEDSDLEDEMLRRAQYTKFCETRPDVNDTKAAEEGEKCAEFINIAPQAPYVDMSFLKSTVPMRYSEVSEDESPEETTTQASPMKRSHWTQEAALPSKKLAGKPPVKNNQQKLDKAMKSKISTFSKLLDQERKIANQHAKRTGTGNGAPAKTTKKNYFSPTAASMNRKNQTRKHVLQQKGEEASQMIMNEKSVVKLRAEKSAIFNKMSRTHERLIDALQQLRNKLLEVYVPESTSDRNRRNRNGFEFSVRFLRNFLYPLKGMIDTTRNTPKESFNSLKSNDACNRVAHIYSLFLQAVLTYGKQLRHFMLDQVPQKLTTLLEMLFSTTNMCLDKRLFDRSDAIVENLLNQCASFLSFLENLHAQRFVAAQESQRKVCVAKDTHSKYDLKMIINDLNMYEPRIVPKRTQVGRGDSRMPKTNRMGGNISAKNAPPQSVMMVPQPPPPPARRIRRRVKQMKNIAKRQQAGTRPRDSSEEVTECKRIEEDVPTQVQECGQNSSEIEQLETRQILENLKRMLEKTPGVDKFDKLEMINRSILDALFYGQNANTQELLQPLLETIDNVMKVPEDDNKIENVFNAIQMRISSLLNERRTQQGYDEGYSLHDSDEEEMSYYEAMSKHDEYQVYELMAEQYDANEDISDLDSGENARSEENRCRPKTDSEENNNNNYINEPDYEDDDVVDACDACVDYEDDDDDVDGRFYISGEDYSAKRTSRSSRKSKLEPLVEMVNESDMAELYSSDAEIYTPKLSLRQRQNQQPMLDSDLMELIFSPKKPSPYDIPLSRRSRSKSQKKFKSPEVAQTSAKRGTNKTTPNQSTSMGNSNSNRPASSRYKVTSVPPSPAMMRLKQIGQPTLTARSKKVNLLKKHIRRNPTGSPPPPPTVSPSTSAGGSPPLDTRRSQQSLSKIPISHKGCSANFSKNSPKLAHHDAVMTHPNSGGQHLNSSASLAAGGKKAAAAVIDMNGGVGERATAGIDEPNEKITHDQSMPADGCGDQKRTPALNPLLEPIQNKTDLKSPSNPNILANDVLERIGVKFDESPLLKERDKFLSMCIRNRLYNNPNFTNPWKILSRFSEQLTNEIVTEVESDLDCGVMSFVNDFLKLETRI